MTAKDATYLDNHPEAAAKAADLIYVSDEDAGYTRKSWGRGFAYFTAQGEHIKDEKLKARFEALVIPPQWEEVWICKRKDGHLQVTGRDGKGRKQYIYHPCWIEIRDQAKFNALISFGDALPDLRAELERDLGRRKLTKEKVTAALIKLLEHTLIRVGNKAYAVENESYGLTTLRKKHVNLKGDSATFEFVGKSGKEHQISLKNKRLVKLVKACYEIPGYELFKYFDDDGEKCTVDSSDINDYLQHKTGRPFTAKDFRTWAGTTLTAEALFEHEADSEAARKQTIVDTIKDVAKRLGNTPSVCRESYIHPLVLSSFEEDTFKSAFGKQLERFKKKPREHLSPTEGATLHFLKEAA